MEKLEEELDATESKLSSTQQKLHEAEKQADESERYLHTCFVYIVSFQMLCYLLLQLSCCLAGSCGVFGSQGGVPVPQNLPQEI